MATDEPRVQHAPLTSVVTAIFSTCGMRAADARLLGESLVAADLRGVHSHGVHRVPEYAQKLTVQGVDPRGTPSVVRDVGACLVVDGGNSMGQIGATFAMAKVIERAAVTGLAAVAVRGSNHCGAMAPYVMQALPHDMIGLATTNTLPVMAPWGSSECILGINPLALSVPAGQEMPIVYDAAWSGSARGKIQVYAQQGRQLPEGWALDSNGRPTTDPLAALDGLLLPIGGFKGTGMAFILGLLSTMLSGASYGTELGSLKAGPHPGEDGHFFMAIKVEAFEEVDRFKRRVDGVLQQLHASRLAPGFDRIYAPGEVEFLTEARYRQEGIPLTAATLQGIYRTAEHFGIDARALGRDVQ